MAIAIKGKRRIFVIGQTFYWKIQETSSWIDLGTAHELSIISENKAFYVQYPLWQNPQPNAHNLMVVLGRMFGGEGSWGFGYQRVQAPVWEDRAPITPRIVRDIIIWCLSDKEIILLTHRGTKITH